MKKKLFLFAAAALALASCSETDELALNKAQQQAQESGIEFDVYTQRALSRAGVPGNAEPDQYGITTESLKTGAHKDGFGVFAYYTSNSEYDTNSSTPNFMYNQQVKWDAQESVWTYEPVKYWPNEFGNAAESDDFDKVSFFAYAPYVPFTVNSGYPVVGPDEDVTLVQKKNIVGTVKNTTSGDPYIKYIVDTDPSTSVDLLWGVAAEKNGYRGMNYEGINGDGNVIPGNCYLDLTKQVGTTDKVKWNFKHALAQLNVQIIQAVDIKTEGSDIYKPSVPATAISTNANGNVDKLTKVYLRWIEFGGFVMKGALNLHSDDVDTPGVENAEPNWKGFDGTNDLTYEPVRFYDGLKDGKEGTTNNKQKNEVQQGLNLELLEEAAEPDAEWKSKKVGIPYAKYANLFEGAKTADDPIYVIPSGDVLSIEMCYDVLTQDEALAGLLSDNKTHGSAIENKISKETGITLEAGKSYTIKIVVGMESVKFDVEVTPWKDNEPKETDVDMPFNPEGKITDLSTITAAYTAQNGETLTGDLGSDVMISIADGATVTLRDVTINGTNDESYKWAGITCTGDATIVLEGTNTLKGFYEDYPGIYVPEGKTLTIKGTGSLTASSNGWGSGIGGGYELSGGNIIISSGTITAMGGKYTGAIGAGALSTCGDITISGGTVTASGSKYGTGIGSGGDGSCGNITISGGTITATGGEYGSGIGNGAGGSCAAITISGGNVTAQGGFAGAGIGCGCYEFNNYYIQSTCGDITISGGTITATGGAYAAGIGGGYYNGNCGTITITSGVTSVTATKGGYVDNSIGAGSEGQAITVTIDDGANVTQN